MILKSLLIYYLFIFFQEKKSSKSKIFNFRLPIKRCYSDDCNSSRMSCKYFNNNFYYLSKSNVAGEILPPFLRLRTACRGVYGKVRVNGKKQRKALVKRFGEKTSQNFWRELKNGQRFFIFPHQTIIFPPVPYPSLPAAATECKIWGCN